MYLVSQPSFVGLISRRKTHGPGLHVGVALPNGMVAHMTPSGPAMVSLAAFAQGREVSRGKECAHDRWQQLQFRTLRSLEGMPPYDLLSRNCEHYATWLLGEKPESSQVNAAVLIGLLGVVVHLVK